ncbi:MAG: nucleotide pyrophosphohydrolase [Proteobacteria bacterium]|nr:MAG: nucleotide pyrophosphohydrolase [Pseudomonadota bacterium]
MSAADSLERIRRLASDFVDERDWQGYQTPKNLAMAMIVEAAELVEHFQWLSAEQSEKPDSETRAGVAEELADVLIYLVRIADELGIDLAASAFNKLEKNARKYKPGSSPR